MTTRPFTGRAVAKRAGVANTTAQRSLNRLVEHGLVVRSRAGSASTYVLNREHVAIDVVEGLAGLRSRLIERLRERFRGWALPPAHASMFGSAARGEGDTSSDIDLLVVRPDDVDEEGQWSEQIADLAQDVYRWTGNVASVIDVSESDYGRLVAEDVPMTRDLLRDAIRLAGAELKEVHAR